MSQRMKALTLASCEGVTKQLDELFQGKHVLIDTLCVNLDDSVQPRLVLDSAQTVQMPVTRVIWISPMMSMPGLIQAAGAEGTETLLRLDGRAGYLVSKRREMARFQYEDAQGLQIVSIHVVGTTKSGSLRRTKRD